MTTYFISLLILFHADNQILFRYFFYFMLMTRLYFDIREFCHCGDCDTSMYHEQKETSVRLWVKEFVLKENFEFHWKCVCVQSQSPELKSHKALAVGTSVCFVTDKADWNIGIALLISVRQKLCHSGQVVLWRIWGASTSFSCWFPGSCAIWPFVEFWCRLCGLSLLEASRLSFRLSSGTVDCLQRQIIDIPKP